jgi:hypothetical protein
MRCSLAIQKLQVLGDGVESLYSGLREVSHSHAVVSRAMMALQDCDAGIQGVMVNILLIFEVVETAHDLRVGLGRRRLITSSRLGRRWSGV